MAQDVPRRVTAEVRATDTRANATETARTTGLVPTVKVRIREFIYFSKIYQSKGGGQSTFTRE